MMFTEPGRDLAARPRLTDHELVLAMLAPDYDQDFVADWRVGEIHAEAHERWGARGPARLRAYRAARLQAAARGLLDLARHHPELLAGVMAGQVPTEVSAQPADEMLARYRDELAIAGDYRARAAALEEQDRTWEPDEVAEPMSLHALHVAADTAAAEAAATAQALLGHMLTTGALPTELATVVDHAAAAGTNRRESARADRPGPGPGDRHYLVRWEIDTYAPDPTAAARAAHAAMTRPGSIATVFDVYTPQTTGGPAPALLARVDLHAITPARRADRSHD